jgi:hypothetical protein
MLIGSSEDSSFFDRLTTSEWHEITFFLVGMMEDASLLISQISLREGHLALQCLIYAKCVNDKVIDEVIARVLEKELTRELIAEVCDNLIYLVQRFDQQRITNLLSEALEKTDNGKRKMNLWKVIDQAMLHFSPQKGMAYVTSDWQWIGESGKWLPGFWMDIYPVTNADYQLWIKTSGIKELPRHWETVANEELPVTEEMKRLPIVDIGFDKANRYASSLNKEIPDQKQWNRVAEIDYIGEGLLNENRKRFIKKEKLEKSFKYYHHTLAFARACDLVNDLTRDSGHAPNHARARVLVNNLTSDSDHTPNDTLVRELARNLGLNLDYALTRDHFRALAGAYGLDLGHTRTRGPVNDLTPHPDRDPDHDPDRDLDHDHAPAHIHALALAHALDRALAHAHVLARVFGLDHALSRSLALARELVNTSDHDFFHARAIARDLSRSLALARDLSYGREKTKISVFAAQEAASIIDKELLKGMTYKARKQIFVTGKALVDGMVTILEIFRDTLPRDLLIVLLQRGLLAPADEFPQNSFGICGLIGNVWEWTSTINEKGDHLICGGAWTEEKFEPDKKEWRPPAWRDINLGFRCVCDWDKIGEVGGSQSEQPEDGG